MANYILDPNMGFPNPTPGQDPGPDWASNLQTSLTTIGAHDHSTGRGVLITPTGININSAFTLNDNNLTAVKEIIFNAQVSPFPGVSPHLGSIYVAGNELYYNDEAGNVVQITLNGSVNSGSGSITGLPSGTASASFSGGTFFWRAATNTGANMDAASYILRNNTVNSFGLTLNPPNALASDYSLTLPLIPGSNSFVTLDTSGNISGSIPTSAGIVGSNIASATITGGNIAAATITGSNIGLGTLTEELKDTMSTGVTVGIGDLAISTSSGSFLSSNPAFVDVTNLTVTITTSGRPVQLCLQPEPTSIGGSGNLISIEGLNTSVVSMYRIVAYLNGAT